MYCLHCRRTFDHVNRNNQATTSSFINHLHRCPELKKKSQSQISEISSYFSPASRSGTTITSANVTKGEIEEQIIKYFTSANVPFNHASDQHFKMLVGMIRVDNKPFKCPSRITLRRKLTSSSEKAVDDLKQVLEDNESKISLALDCWSSRSNDAYLCTF